MTDEPKKKRTPRVIIPPGASVHDPALVPGRFAAANPTCGQDLMAEWDLPPVAATNGRVKVLRKEYGSNMLTLVGEVQVADYSLADVAASWGPGEYVVQLAADPSRLWKTRSAQVRVAPEYAQGCGWSPMAATPIQVSPPGAQTLRSYSALSDAAQGKGQLAPLDVAAIVEATAARVAEQMAARFPPVPQAPAQDYSQTFALFNALQSLTEKAVERDRALYMGATKLAMGGGGETSWAEVVREALPSLVGVVGQIGAAIVGGRAPQPPMLEDVVDDEPEPQPIQPPEEPLAINITLEDRSYLAPAIGMLTPFVDHILNVLETAGVEPAAAELAQYIPRIMAPRLVRLVDLAREHGPDVLAVVSRKFARHDVAQLLEAIARRLEKKKVATPPG